MLRQVPAVKDEYRRYVHELGEPTGQVSNYKTRSAINFDDYDVDLMS